jgi:hypothetical protein
MSVLLFSNKIRLSWTAMLLRRLTWESITNKGIISKTPGKRWLIRIVAHTFIEGKPLDRSELQISGRRNRMDNL